MFSEELKTFRRLGFRHVCLLLVCGPPMCSYKPQVLLQSLNFASVIASGLMIWKGLGLITNTESPIVVVLRFVPLSRVFHCNRLTDVVSRWHLHSIAATFYSSQIRPTYGIKQEILRCTRFLEKEFQLSTGYWRHMTPFQKAGAKAKV